MIVDDARKAWFSMRNLESEMTDLHTFFRFEAIVFFIEAPTRNQFLIFRFRKAHFYATSWVRVQQFAFVRCIHTANRAMRPRQPCHVVQVFGSTSFFF
jgi:hypothetical protein